MVLALPFTSTSGTPEVREPAAGTPRQSAGGGGAGHLQARAGGSAAVLALEYPCRLKCCPPASQKGQAGLRWHSGCSRATSDTVYLTAGTPWGHKMCVHFVHFPHLAQHCCTRTFKNFCNRWRAASSSAHGLDGRVSEK